VPVSTRDWTYNWGWQDAEGAIGLVGGYAASYAAMYQRQPWVYIAVNKLSRGIGRLPLKVYHGEERERDRDSPLAKLLARPYPGGTPFGLKSAIVGDLGIYGNAIVIKQGGGGARIPQALYPVSPLGWSIADDGRYLWRNPKNGQEKGYRPTDHALPLLAAGAARHGPRPAGAAAHDAGDRGRGAAPRRRLVPERRAAERRDPHRPGSARSAWPS
jgi:phage portal protein BeeE